MTYCFKLSIIWYDLHILLKIQGLGAKEMGQWLGVLTAFPDDPGSIPSTHMTVQQYL